jgi:phosphoenolpyruvate carboxykinase (GTP)
VSRLDKNAVKFYGVNWFRRNSHGEFVWPGFGDNARVLRWVFDRCAGRAGAKEDLLGLVPGKEMDTTGLNVDLEQVFYVGRNEVVQEMADARKYLNSLGGEKAVPKRLYEEIDRIEKNALATAKLQQVA